MEGIDRLLLVTDDKNRAPDRAACAVARCEFLRKLVDHVPLRGAGVLGFIDKDVVDPSVQAVQHPLGLLAVGQKGSRLADEIVEIEPAARLLGVFVAAQERVGKAMQLGVSVDCIQRKTRFPRGLDAKIEVFQSSDTGGKRAFAQFGGGGQ